MRGLKKICLTGLIVGISVLVESCDNTIYRSEEKESNVDFNKSKYSSVLALDLNGNIESIQDSVFTRTPDTTYFSETSTFYIDTNGNIFYQSTEYSDYLKQFGRVDSETKVLFDAYGLPKYTINIKKDGSKDTTEYIWKDLYHYEWLMRGNELNPRQRKGVHYLNQNYRDSTSEFFKKDPVDNEFKLSTIHNYFYSEKNIRIGKEVYSNKWTYINYVDVEKDSLENRIEFVLDDTTKGSWDEIVKRKIIYR